MCPSLISISFLVVTLAHSHPKDQNTPIKAQHTLHTHIYTIERDLERERGRSSERENAYDICV